MMSFKENEDSDLFQMKARKQNFPDQNHEFNKLIRFRKTNFMIDGEERVIVIIRDLTDSIKVDKMLIQTQGENWCQKLSSEEIQESFRAQKTAV
jgi:hypothetical protein